MSLRIRENGDIFCAAMNKEEPDDTYVGDEIHGLLCDNKMIVTTPEPEHSKTGGQWWWKGKEPKDVIIDPWWYEQTD